MNKIKTKLKQIINKTANKTYTYLAIIISKRTMDQLNPKDLILKVQPPVTFKIRKRYDGRGYVILPREIVSLFNFKKDQRLETELKFEETKWR